MPTIDNWRALREALDAGPTGGRWRWEINMENKRLHLVGGPYREFDLTIMDFDRWGMGGAVATLRDTSVDGMNIMHRLPDRKDWVAPFPGRAHHANWCQQVTHPDMRWIQEASPKVIRSLLDERDRLATDAQNCKELIWALARELKCLPSTFSDANGHVLKAAIALNAERDRLAAEAQHAADVAEAYKAQADSLAAEVEALRADAGRYRWLRDVSVPPHNFYVAVPVEFEGVKYTPAEVDAGIDAAMKGKP